MNIPWHKKKGPYSKVGKSGVLIAHPIPLFNAILLDDYVLKKATHQYASFFVGALRNVGILKSRYKTYVNQHVYDRTDSEFKKTYKFSPEFLDIVNYDKEIDRDSVFITGGVKVLNHKHSFIKSAFIYEWSKSDCRRMRVASWIPSRVYYFLSLFRFSYLECVERFGTHPSDSLKNLYDATGDVLKYIEMCFIKQGIDPSVVKGCFPDLFVPDFLKNNSDEDFRTIPSGSEMKGLFAVDSRGVQDPLLNLSFLDKYSPDHYMSDDTFRRCKTLWVCKLRDLFLGTRTKISDNPEINHKITENLCKIVRMSSNGSDEYAGAGGEDLFPGVSNICYEGPNVPMYRKFVGVDLLGHTSDTEKSLRLLRELMKACMGEAKKRLDKWMPGWTKSLDYVGEIRQEHIVFFALEVSHMNSFSLSTAAKLYYSMKEEDKTFWVNKQMIDRIAKLAIADRKRITLFSAYCKDKFVNRRSSEVHYSLDSTLINYSMRLGEELVAGVPPLTSSEVDMIYHQLSTGKVGYEGFNNARITTSLCGDVGNTYSFSYFLRLPPPCPIT